MLDTNPTITCQAREDHAESRHRFTRIPLGDLTRFAQPYSVLIKASSLLETEPFILIFFFSLDVRSSPDSRQASPHVETAKAKLVANENPPAERRVKVAENDWYP
jgi:hypothetical protein